MDKSLSPYREDFNPFGEFFFLSDSDHVLTVPRRINFQGKYLKNQSLSFKSDKRTTCDTSSPIQGSESDLAHRIAELMGEEPLVAFARRCGIGENTLRKYLGGAEPSTNRLVAIADTAGVNIAWLAAGRGPKRGSAASAPAKPAQPLNMELLTAAVQGVQEGLHSIKRTLSPEKHAELILASYELLVETEGHASKANVIKFIRAAA